MLYNEFAQVIKSSVVKKSVMFAFFKAPIKIYDRIATYRDSNKCVLSNFYKKASRNFLYSLQSLVRAIGDISSNSESETISIFFIKYSITEWIVSE